GAWSRRQAEQQVPLTARGCRRYIAGTPDREIFCLRTGPYRHQKVGERCTGPNQIAGRTAIDAVHEAGSARLDDGDVALVEIDRAGGCEARSRSTPVRYRRAQSECLDARRIDGHTGLTGSLVGIF